jgi:hypothetical protein
VENGAAALMVVEHLADSWDGVLVLDRSFVQSVTDSQGTAATFHPPSVQRALALYTRASAWGHQPVLQWHPSWALSVSLNANRLAVSVMDLPIFQ